MMMMVIIITQSGPIDDDDDDVGQSHRLCRKQQPGKGRELVGCLLSEDCQS